MSKAADSKSNGSHKKKGTRDAGSDADVAPELKGGESVEWKLRGSIHHGQLIAMLTEPSMVNDTLVSASVKEPKWLVEEDIDSKRMCALVPSAVFKKGELEVKENAKEKEAEAKHAEAEAKTKEKEKEKVKETKAIKSKAPGAVVEHKHKESGSGVTKQTEETKEPAAAASKAAPKVTTKVASS